MTVITDWSVQAEWIIWVSKRRSDKWSVDRLHWRRCHQVWTTGQYSEQPAGDHVEGAWERLTHGLFNRCK